MIVNPRRLAVTDALKTDDKTVRKVELILEMSNRKKELAKAYAYSKFWNPSLHAKALDKIKQKGFTIEQMEDLIPDSWQEVMNGKGVTDRGLRT